MASKPTIDFDGFDPLEKDLLTAAARIVEALRRCPAKSDPTFVAWECRFYKEVISASELEQGATTHRVHAIIASAMVCYNRAQNDSKKLDITTISVDDPGVSALYYKEMPEGIALGENCWWTTFPTLKEKRDIVPNIATTSVQGTEGAESMAGMKRKWEIGAEGRIGDEVLAGDKGKGKGKDEDEMKKPPLKRTRKPPKRTDDDTKDTAPIKAESKPPRRAIPAKPKKTNIRLTSDRVGPPPKLTFEDTARIVVASHIGPAPPDQQLTLPATPPFDDLDRPGYFEVEEPTFEVPITCRGLTGVAVYEEAREGNAGPFEDNDTLNQYGLPTLFTLPNGCQLCQNAGVPCQMMCGETHHCLRCRSKKKGCPAVEPFKDDDVGIAHALAWELRKHGREFTVVVPALASRVLSKQRRAKLRHSSADDEHVEDMEDVTTPLPADQPSTSSYRRSARAKGKDKATSASTSAVRFSASPARSRRGSVPRTVSAGSSKSPVSQVMLDQKALAPIPEHRSIQVAEHLHPAIPNLDEPTASTVSDPLNHPMAPSFQAPSTMVSGRGKTPTLPTPDGTIDIVSNEITSTSFTSNAIASTSIVSNEVVSTSGVSNMIKSASAVSDPIASTSSTLNIITPTDSKSDATGSTGGALNRIGSMSEGSKAIASTGGASNVITSTNSIFNATGSGGGVSNGIKSTSASNDMGSTDSRANATGSTSSMSTPIDDSANPEVIPMDIESAPPAETPSAHRAASIPNDQVVAMDIDPIGSTDKFLSADDAFPNHLPHSAAALSSDAPHIEGSSVDTAVSTDLAVPVAALDGSLAMQSSVMVDSSHEETEAPRPGDNMFLPPEPTSSLPINTTVSTSDRAVTGVDGAVTSSGSGADDVDSTPATRLGREVVASDADGRAALTESATPHQQFPNGALRA
ncbi:hypothetical protein EUX98_g3350 [Antrodiella citrinella]|uniref:Zn(2)-C6 fungal-type domain-containing protein n=1 Tax=Antrodiella citrinella TaxID=2447956 RepID=A0A4S4N4X3_9APHY|nr:hypothetical protein EUX98_g3350 [Antrodiella citrinella]